MYCFFFRALLVVFIIFFGALARQNNNPELLEEYYQSQQVIFDEIEREIKAIEADLKARYRLENSTENQQRKSKFILPTSSSAIPPVSIPASLVTIPHEPDISHSLIRIPISGLEESYKRSRQQNGGYPFIDYSSFNIPSPNTFARRIDWWNSLTDRERQIIYREENIIRNGYFNFEKNLKKNELVEKNTFPDFRKYKSIAHIINRKNLLEYKLREIKDLRVSQSQDQIEAQRLAREDLRNFTHYNGQRIDIAHIDTDKIAHLILDDINTYRTQKGISAIKMNLGLAEIAQAHAYNMNIHDFNGKFDHLNRGTLTRVFDAGLYHQDETYIENTTKFVWHIFDLGCRKVLGSNQLVSDCLLINWRKRSILNKDILNFNVHSAGIGVHYEKKDNTIAISVLLSSDKFK